MTTEFTFTYTTGIGPDYQGELDTLRKYAEVVEKFWDKALEEHHILVEQIEPTRIEYDDGCVYLDFHDEEIACEEWQLSERFPLVFRYSLFVQCYTYHEDNLTRICHRYARRGCEPLNDAEAVKKDRGIKKAQKYLKQVVGMGDKFPDQTPEWQELRDYNLIRNLIVHYDGRVPDNYDAKKRKRVLKFIDRHTSIDLPQPQHWSSERFIQLSRDFCPEFIDTLSRFFEKLVPALPYYSAQPKKDS